MTELIVPVSPIRGLFRVTTCLENPEMSEFDSCQGNVRDFTENRVNVWELSMKKSCQGKVA